MTEVIEQPNQEKIKTLGEKETWEVLENIRNGHQ